MESLVQWFTTALSSVPKELILFIISMIPILELRGGLIAAALLGVGWGKAMIICIIGNMLPMPFVLLLATAVFGWLKKLKWIRPLVEKLEKRAYSKGDKLQKAEFWGLLLFVGIPLPGTGGWTGSLAASLLGIRFKKAFPAVILGILLASVIMSVVSYLIPWIVASI